MEIEIIGKVAKYLDVRIGKPTINSDQMPKLSIDGEEYTGLATVILKLIKTSKQQFPNDKQHECLIYQWLEFASCNALNINSQQGKAILKELNSYLENYSYLVGYCRTVADVVVYHLVYDAILSMNASDKETHLNLCRWFDHIQFDQEVRQDNKIVNFSSNYVGGRISVHH